MDSVRAAIRADKRQLVAANMVLTTEENAAFWPVYDAYQAELGKLNTRTINAIKSYATRTMPRRSPMLSRRSSPTSTLPSRATGWH